MQPYATIQLNIYKSGIMVSCEDTGDEIFINKNDGNLQPLVDFINKVDEECNPETTYTLTEKGKETLAAINSGANIEDLTEQQKIILKILETLPEKVTVDEIMAAYKNFLAKKDN